MADLILRSKGVNVSHWGRYSMKVELEDVYLASLVEGYKAQILEEFDIDDLIKAVEEQGYKVEAE